MLSASSYDAVVVGGGHNGLVCAAYLARAGLRTTVVERRHLVGGAAVTEEPWPMIDCVIPTTKDPTIAPQGAHIMNCFVQYVPYQPADGPWDDAKRDALANTVIDTIAHFAPNFKDAVTHRQVLTPYDLEQRFGLLGGNIFHGEISPDQLFSLRPSPLAAGYRTPVAGLYLCGSGTHPGGGVMGIPGLNASRVIIRDSRQRTLSKRA
jgi:phytoene dehydrogenase-like protein